MNVRSTAAGYGKVIHSRALPYVNGKLCKAFGTPADTGEKLGTGPGASPKQTNARTGYWTRLHKVLGMDFRLNSWRMKSEYYLGCFAVMMARYAHSQFWKENVGIQLIRARRSAPLTVFSSAAAAADSIMYQTEQ